METLHGIPWRRKPVIFLRREFPALISERFGQESWIAQTCEEYIEIAVRLAFLNKEMRSKFQKVCRERERCSQPKVEF